MALACTIVGAGSFAPAVAAPVQRPPQGAPHAAIDSGLPGSAPRATNERPAPARTVPAAQRRPEAQRAPAPSLWNPLKRKRMAMPAIPAPPDADVDYAF